MGQVQPELTFRALSHLLIVFLAVILVVLSLVSMWKENRFGWPLREAGGADAGERVGVRESDSGGVTTTR